MRRWVERQNDIMAKPTRHDRLVDLVALAGILLAIALYVDGNARLKGIQRFSYQHPGPPGVRQLDMADFARYEANAGIALAILGCGAGAVHAVRVKRRLPLAGLS
jgi:hypothetical protein